MVFDLNNQLRADFHLAVQGFVYRAFVGNLKQPLLLFVGPVAFKTQLAIKRVDLAAIRFKSLVGQPMFQYVTVVRMQRAKELLRDTVLPVYEVASRAGYESDLAFA